MNEVHIPTITGKINTISIPTPSQPIYGGYKSLVTQVAGNAPTEVIKSNTLGVTGVWSYVGMGRYELTLSAPVVDPIVYSGGITHLPLCVAQAGVNSPTVIGFTSTKLGVYGDDLLLNTAIVIEAVSVAVPTNAEQVFNYILSQLDAVQINYWLKIVVRFNNVVTEVDGTLYRLPLGDFANSSKRIYS